MSLSIPPTVVAALALITVCIRLAIFARVVDHISLRVRRRAIVFLLLIQNLLSLSFSTTQIYYNYIEICSI